MPNLTVWAADAAKDTANAFARQMAEQQGRDPSGWIDPFQTRYADADGNIYWLFTYDVSDDFASGLSPDMLPGLALWTPPEPDAEPAPLPAVDAAPIVAVIGLDVQNVLAGVGLTYSPEV